MEPGIVLLAVAVGYFIGSISFARLVARIVRPSADVTLIVTELGGGATFTSDSVSATAVRMKVGRGFGIATALLDMAKVAIPVLAFSLAFPGEPYVYLVAAAGLVGHDWPVYYRFKGGRGETSIIGALLVLDPVGLVAMVVLGMVIGFLAGNILVLRWAGLVLMIPWMFVVHGPAAGLYMAFAVGVYVFAMRPELTQYWALRSGEHDPSNEEIADEFGMGAGLGRAIDRYSIPALVARRRSPAA